MIALSRMVVLLSLVPQAGADLPPGGTVRESGRLPSDQAGGLSGRCRDPVVDGSLICLLSKCVHTVNALQYVVQARVVTGHEGLPAGR